MSAFYMVSMNSFCNQVEVIGTYIGLHIIYYKLNILNYRSNLKQIPLNWKHLLSVCTFGLIFMCN
jgi:hypothetical protein